MEIVKSETTVLQIRCTTNVSKYKELSFWFQILLNALPVMITAKLPISLKFSLIVNFFEFILCLIILKLVLINFDGKACLILTRNHEKFNKTFQEPLRICEQGKNMCRTGSVML